MKLKFKCPDCGCEILDEIIEGGHQNTSIYSVSEEADLEYGESTFFGDGVDHYECNSCGYVLRHEKGYPIADSYALVEWLQKQPNNAPDGASGLLDDPADIGDVLEELLKFYHGDGMWPEEEAKILDKASETLAAYRKGKGATP